MDLSNITYQGSAFQADPEVEALLPDNLLSLLKQINGFIQFGGGLHVRGLCNEPEWHSLRAALFGESAIHKLYPSVEKTDIPFAQDCVADQYLLRERTVFKLFAETGELESLDFGLGSFLSAASNDPVEFLGLEPLLQIQSQGQHLEPGQVIHVYPPFCTKEAKNGVSLNPVSTTEAIAFISGFSEKIKTVGNGGKVEIRVTE
jgi:hypothetical protein